jgi:hypothetical protein
MVGDSSMLWDVQISALQFSFGGLHRCINGASNHRNLDEDFLVVVILE